MFSVGNVPVKGRLILAPMAGFSDSPYRDLTHEMGSAMSYSEFVSTDGISRGNQKSIKLFRFLESERPVVFQIFGNDAKTIVEAAKIVQDLGPDIIDLNMGCSVRKVAMKGSGAGLLRNPLEAGRIMEELAKNLSIPVTAKIRLGWSSSQRNYLEVARILEQSGASLIAVHGRTKDQAYTGKADWNAIGEIKARAGIPVLGNGDITSAREAEQRINEFKVDGVLIGRAAIGNPWIFSGVERENVPLPEVIAVMRRHLQAMVRFYDLPYGLTLFRKHAVKYLRLFDGAASYRSRLVRTDSLEEFESILDEILSLQGSHVSVTMQEAI